MHGIFANCVLAALLLAGALADHHHHRHNHGSGNSHEGKMSCHKLSRPNADFAFALYRNLNAKTDAGKNIFYSPLGISTALSMVSTGAGGDTHSQLFSILGYGALNQSQVNEGYENLFHMLGHSQENQKLDVGNAVALRAGFNPLESFLKEIKHYYSGDIFNVDLAKPAEAVAEINAYISNKTHDRIKDMVKDLDKDMVMMLINYVYFKGEWEKPFNKDVTHKADFHVDDTTKVQVDMMKRTGYYNIYHDADNHTTIIMLPYKGTTSMMIVLPDEGKMKEVEGFISKEHLRHWRNSVSEEYIDLYLPKFSISVCACLRDTLKELGITNAFEDNADFSGISNETKSKVSKVSHRTSLSVTEMGTEAAAISIAELIYLMLPPSVTIDRPFLVFIMERSTRSILFMGKISNPTLM
ncbi:alpha-1-antitrypsin homolog [Acanthochromis polyacanthus]|uniref:alpha-1-antitrypsin homolog n=1 Tax=Acanthochromis polyacanthus TaxID=80966 RepID=UPI002234398D|nr:alpha-1-antitrypsin homolog [Acanthochromis polyacanthus]